MYLLDFSNTVKEGSNKIEIEDKKLEKEIKNKFKNLKIALKIKKIKNKTRRQFIIKDKKSLMTFLKILELESKPQILNIGMNILKVGLNEKQNIVTGKEIKNIKLMKKGKYYGVFGYIPLKEGLGEFIKKISYITNLTNPTSCMFGGYLSEKGKYYLLFIQ